MIGVWCAGDDFNYQFSMLNNQFSRSCTSDLLLLIAYCPLKTAYCRLLTAYCPLKTAHCLLPIEDCLQISLGGATARRSYSIYFFSNWEVKLPKLFICHSPIILLPEFSEEVNLCEVFPRL